MRPEPGAGFEGIVGVRQVGGEHRLLTPLDALHHRREQSFAGAEVVVQHPAAGAEFGGQRAHAGIADAVFGEPGDGLVE